MFFTYIFICMLINNIFLILNVSCWIMRDVEFDSICDRSSW